MEYPMKTPFISLHMSHRAAGLNLAGISALCVSIPNPGERRETSSSNTYGHAVGPGSVMDGSQILQTTSKRF